MNRICKILFFCTLIPILVNCTGKQKHQDRSYKNYIENTHPEISNITVRSAESVGDSLMVRDIQLFNAITNLMEEHFISFHYLEKLMSFYQENNITVNDTLLKLFKQQVSTSWYDSVKAINYKFVTDFAKINQIIQLHKEMNPLIINSITKHDSIKHDVFLQQKKNLLAACQIMNIVIDETKPLFKKYGLNTASGSYQRPHSLKVRYTYNDIHGNKKTNNHILLIDKENDKIVYDFVLRNWDKMAH